MSSSFKIVLTISRTVAIQGKRLSREDFYEWVWRELGSSGLQGIHEGSLLTDEAADQGLETERWTVDSGEAPRDRDWIGGQSILQAELYFDGEKSARAAARMLTEQTDAQVLAVEEVTEQDWDAEWKASFTGAAVPPFWQVLPPWQEPERQSSASSVVLRVNPGAGFGTGTHETTQLCLRVLGEAAQFAALAGKRVLDFGSGSGILAIGAALLGAKVDAVEIDAMAIENARENAELNGLNTQSGQTGPLCFSQALEPGHTGYDLILANILRPVLLEFADTLVARLNGNGILILSGLIDSDVASVSECYSALMGGRKPRVLALNEWRALAW